MLIMTSNNLGGMVVNAETDPKERGSENRREPPLKAANNREQLRAAARSCGQRKQLLGNDG